MQYQYYAEGEDYDEDADSTYDPASDSEDASEGDDDESDGWLSGSKTTRRSHSGIDDGFEDVDPNELQDLQEEAGMMTGDRA